MKKAVIPLLAILFLAVIFFPSRASAVSCPNCGGDMAVTGTSAAPQPDCTNAGVYTYQCADCGHVTTVRSGPLGHDYVADPLEDPDCTHGGRVLYVCVRCQDTYTEDTPPSATTMTLRSCRRPTVNTADASVTSAPAARIPMNR